MFKQSINVTGTFVNIVQKNVDFFSHLLKTKISRRPSGCHVPLLMFYMVLAKGAEVTGIVCSIPLHMNALAAGFDWIEKVFFP